MSDKRVLLGVLMAGALVLVLLLLFLPTAQADSPATARVSVDSAGTQGNDGSWVPSTSAEGRFVAFASGATNLVANDTNGSWDIFVLRGGHGGGDWGTLSETQYCALVRPLTS